MPEYKGPERRINSVDLDMYTTVCDKRFTSINEELVSVRDDTQYLRRKIDNGLSGLPSDVKDLRRIFRNVIFYGVLPVILALIAGAGFWLYSFGRIEARLDEHVVNSEAMISEILSEVKDK